MHFTSTFVLGMMMLAVTIAIGGEEKRNGPVCTPDGSNPYMIPCGLAPAPIPSMGGSLPGWKGFRSPYIGDNKEAEDEGFFYTRFDFNPDHKRSVEDCSWDVRTNPSLTPCFDDPIMNKVFPGWDNYLPAIKRNSYQFLLGHPNFIRDHRTFWRSEIPKSPETSQPPEIPKSPEISPEVSKSPNGDKHKHGVHLVPLSPPSPGRPRVVARERYEMNKTPLWRVDLENFTATYEWLHTDPKVPRPDDILVIHAPGGAGLVQKACGQFSVCPNMRTQRRWKINGHVFYEVLEGPKAQKDYFHWLDTHKVNEVLQDMHKVTDLVVCIGLGWMNKEACKWDRNPEDFYRDASRVYN